MKTNLYLNLHLRLVWIIIMLMPIFIWQCQKQESNAEEHQKEKVEKLESIAVAPNGRYVAVIDYPGRLWVMDLQSLPLKMLVVDSIQPLITPAFSWDGQYLLVSGIDSTIYAWRTDTWERLQDTLKLSHRIVNTLTNQPYSNFWISGSGWHEYPVFTLFSFQTDSFPYFAKQKVLFDSDWFEYPNRIIFHPSGNELVVRGYAGDLMRFTFNSKRIFKHPYSIFTGKWHGFTSLSFSPCGNFLAFKPLIDSAIFIYDWNKNRIIQAFDIDSDANTAFSWDGKSLICISPNAGDSSMLYIWETQTWKLKQKQKLPSSYGIYNIDNIPFRKWVVIYDAFTLFIWDYAKNRLLFQKEFPYSLM